MKRLCLSIAVLLAGCSFVFTSGPSGPSNPPRYPDCTRSMTWPIVDGVFSVLFLVAMANAIAEDSDEQAGDINDDESTKAEKVTSAALFAAATGIGAFVGYKRVGACRGATERFHAAYPNGVHPYYPQPYYPPQQYPPQQYPPAQPYTPPPMAAPPPPVGAPPTQQPPAVPTALGTEGDVCASNAECATGLTCTSNVCIRPK